MSKRLFIDCDDTLVLYGGGHLAGGPRVIHPYVLTSGEPHEYNRPLVDSIRAFTRDHPSALTVVWSGGGAQYARVVADVVLPGVNVAALTKGKETFELVRHGDIVVDDQDIDVPAFVFRPDEWTYERKTT